MTRKLRQLMLLATPVIATALVYAQAHRPKAPGSAPRWGQITGNIQNQTDLQAQFAATTTPWGKITGDIQTQSDLQNALNARAPAYAAAHLQSGVNYSLTGLDNGAIVAFNNTAAIALTLPSGLPVGFSCLVLQLGSGQVSFSGSSVAIQQRQKLTKTAGPYAIVTVIAYAKDTFVLSGDMSQ